MVINKNKIFIFAILALIFLLALFIRLNGVVGHPETMVSGFGPFVDTHIFHKLAFNLYSGNGFSAIDDGRAYGLGIKDKNLKYPSCVTKAPLYPSFMCLIYKTLANPDDMKSPKRWHKVLDKVRIIQCFLDAGICIILYLMIRLIIPFSPVPALISAFLYSVNAFNIYYTRMLLSEALTSFLVISSIFFFIAALKTHKKIFWFLMGIGFGLVTLNRAEYILFIFFAILYIQIIYRDKFPYALKISAILIIPFFLTVLPWTARNYYVSGRIIPVAAAGIGLNLFAGTYESNTNWVGWRQRPESAYRSKAEKKQIKELSARWRRDCAKGTLEFQKEDREFLRLALDRIVSDPFHIIKLWFTRIPRLWYQFYVPIYHDREPPGSLFILYFLLAGSAFFFSGKKEKITMAPVFLMFIYLTAIFLPLHIEPRYGLSAIPGIIGLAGIGTWELASFAGNKLRTT